MSYTLLSINGYPWVVEIRWTQFVENKEYKLSLWSEIEIAPKYNEAWIHTQTIVIPFSKQLIE